MNAKTILLPAYWWNQWIDSIKRKLQKYKFYRKYMYKKMLLKDLKKKLDKFEDVYAWTCTPEFKSGVRQKLSVNDFTGNVIFDKYKAEGFILNKNKLNKFEENFRTDILNELDGIKGDDYIPLDEYNAKHKEFAMKFYGNEKITDVTFPQYLEGEFPIFQLYEDLKYSPLLKVRMVCSNILYRTVIFRYFSSILPERIWYYYDNEGTDTFDCLLTQEEYDKIPKLENLTVSVIEYDSLKEHNWPLKLYNENEQV